MRRTFIILFILLSICLLPLFFVEKKESGLTKVKKEERFITKKHDTGVYTILDTRSKKEYLAVYKIGLIELKE